MSDFVLFPTLKKGISSTMTACGTNCMRHSTTNVRPLCNFTMGKYTIKNLFNGRLSQFH